MRHQTESSHLIFFVSIFGNLDWWIDISPNKIIYLNQQNQQSNCNKKIGVSDWLANFNTCNFLRNFQLRFDSSSFHWNYAALDFRLKNILFENKMSIVLILYQLWKKIRTTIDSSISAHICYRWRKEAPIVHRISKSVYF